MITLNELVVRALELAGQQGVDLTTAPPEPEPICPVCGGIGFISADLRSLPMLERQAHPAFGKLFPCDDPSCAAGEQARQRQEQAQMSSTGLLREYRDYTFDSFTKQGGEHLTGKWIAYGACAAFAQSPRHFISVSDMHRIIGGKLTLAQFRDHMRVYDDYARRHLVLYGAPGVGKTGLVSAVINAMKGKGKAALYIRARDLFEEIYRQRNAEEYPTSSDVLDKFKKARLLVLDEANIENYTEARLDWMETVIRHRMAQELPTLMTCNLTPDQFEAAWGTRTYAVLRSKAWWIEVKGNVLRRVDEPLSD